MTYSDEDLLLPVLSLLEARVLGVLAEKQHTVPDIYPLTLNALISGCNQKSSRDPVINASHTEVEEAIENLKQMSLVGESSGGRTARFSHNIERVLKIPSQSVALIASLMLRGPQTAGELRITSERLHKFADISSVESFLEELAERTDGSLVVKLPRQLGARENRWMHLLSGTPKIKEDTHLTHKDQANNIVSNYEFKALQSDIARLETEVATLRKIVENLSAQLGLDINS
ncbi:MAG: YceH family protein [Burkholderiales bacterium]|nr:YceH family protein [Burkholderiales bacterium]MDR4517901.1 YceH family protein [Nitrosomonas sp.]